MEARKRDQDAHELNWANAGTNKYNFIFAFCQPRRPRGRFKFFGRLLVKVPRRRLRPDGLRFFVAVITAVIKYGPPYRASKYSSGEMTATTYSERVKISLRGPLCAGEAYFGGAAPNVSHLSLRTVRTRRWGH